MARTPLLRALRRLAREHAVAEHLGITPAELRNHRSADLSRRDFIRRSRAELTVAKDQNVRLRSGWFSERDACYLASGKPVVAQETGFSKFLPTGEGLFAFTDRDEALAAVEEVNGDYRRHAEAARRVAEEHFEATAVAGRLLADVGVA